MRKKLKNSTTKITNIDGFDMSYEGFENLCKEAWKEKNSYLKINRLDDEEKYCNCIESKKDNSVFTPVTYPF